MLEDLRSFRLANVASAAISFITQVSDPVLAIGNLRFFMSGYE